MVLVGLLRVMENDGLRVGVDLLTMGKPSRSRGSSPNSLGYFVAYIVGGFFHIGTQFKFNGDIGRAPIGSRADGAYALYTIQRFSRGTVI